MSGTKYPLNLFDIISSENTGMTVHNLGMLIRNRTPLQCVSVYHLLLKVVF